MLGRFLLRIDFTLTQLAWDKDKWLKHGLPNFLNNLFHSLPQGVLLPLMHALFVSYLKLSTRPPEAKLWATEHWGAMNRGPCQTPIRCQHLLQSNQTSHVLLLCKSNQRCHIALLLVQHSLYPSLEISFSIYLRVFCNFLTNNIKSK